MTKVLRDFLVVTSLWLASVCSIAAEVGRPTLFAWCLSMERFLAKHLPVGGEG